MKDKGLQNIIYNEFIQQRRVNMKRKRVNNFLVKLTSGQFERDRKEEKLERKNRIEDSIG